MDAKEYDRIADLLMQIRKKYAKIRTNDEKNITMKQTAMSYLDSLLWINDVFAENDGKGWL